MINPQAAIKLLFVGKLSKRTIRAMFNPSQVSIGHGFAHGSHAIPGRSHPIYGGGAGRPETIGMTLRLDGDRGRVGTKPRFHGASVSATERRPLDIMPEIHELKSMVLPHSPNRDDAYGTPEPWLVEWGTILNATVLVHSVDANITMMLPNGTALLADVTIAMEVVEFTNRTTWTYLKDDNTSEVPDGA